ncbi:MAG: hypothetical protein HQL69_21035 [Magnetococcales bacterium]|nr:hypothetical protein [Magnetococcales bacterium]
MMKINPGGRLAPKDVVGRDEEIKEYWDILDQQGLILAAERRIGKSSIIFKMRDSSMDDCITFYQDLSQNNTVLDLVRSIFYTVEDNLPGLKKYLGKAYHAWRFIPKKIWILELPNAKNRWRDHLANTIEELITAAGTDKKVVLFWDEFPVMLHKIKRNEGDDVAMDLLDQLRVLRQKHTNLRLVFTGSIGLHLVLRGLSLAGNPNTPVNDMYQVEVKPLSKGDTINLSRDLLLNNIAPPPDNVDDLANQIANKVEGFAYYVHHIAALLKRGKYPLTIDGVDAAVDFLVNDPRDTADLQDYATRLDKYYEADEKIIARIILNALSTEEQPIGLEKIINLVRSNDSAVEAELIKDVVDLLWRDHYLMRTPETTYRFRWKMVEKWWLENRT